MSAKKVTKDTVDVSYRNGFMVGRMVAIDETEGFEVPVPGVDVRIRVAAVAAYSYGAPNCLLVSLGEEEEAFQVWGTMEAMDDVVARDRLVGLQPQASGDYTAKNAPPAPDGSFDGGPKVNKDGLKIVPWVDPDQRA